MILPELACYSYYSISTIHASILFQIHPLSPDRILSPLSPFVIPVWKCIILLSYIPPLKSISIIELHNKSPTWTKTNTSEPQSIKLRKSYSSVERAATSGPKNFHDEVGGSGFFIAFIGHLIMQRHNNNAEIHS